MTTNQPYRENSRSRSRSNVVLIAFLVIGAFAALLVALFTNWPET